MKTVALSIATLLLAVGLLSAAPGQIADATDDTPTIQYFVTDTEYDACIVGVTEDVDAASKLFIEATDATKSDTTTTGKPVMYLMVDGYDRCSSDLTSYFSKIINDKDVLAFFNTYVDWSQIEFPKSYPASATAYAIRLTDFGTSCFSTVVGNLDEAMDDLATWADSRSEENELLYSVASSTDYDEIYLSSHEYDSSGYGCTSVRTIYTMLSDSGTGLDYYAASYFVTLESNDSSYNSGLDVKSEMSEGTMWRYGPTATSGTSTAGVNVSASVGSSGVSYTVGSSWSYSIPDVVVSDYSRPSVNTLDIRHDINESANVGRGSYSVEPGKLVTVENGQGYNGVDTYKSQFCKHYWFGFGAFNDVSVSYSINF